MSWVACGGVGAIGCVAVPARPSMTAGEGEAARASGAGSRLDVTINGGWKFLRSDAVAAETVGFDDAAWAAVTLPHTWNALDGQDGGNDYYRGVGWYRKHQPLDGNVAGKRVYLQFDGANIVADVYVNGVALGQHRGGFSRFRFDATAALKPGADNVIAVRVNNAPVTDVAPLDADFTFFGGLYRDVHLLITSAVHIDTQDFASSGVYLDTSAVSADSAHLRARVRVRNDGSAAASAVVTTTIVRADGSAAATLSAQASVSGGTTREMAADTTIARPHLWDGLRDPYVYRAEVQVRVGGLVTDAITVPLGFRSFSVDAARGFTLNGRYVDLHGVNRHQDRLDMGWAISSKEHDEDMALIQEMGANIVRLSHYQQAEYFHALGDRAGMVLWAEIPLVNEITPTAAFSENAFQQMKELIRQNYNHPSILFWGLGNEQHKDTPPTNALLAALNALAHAEDPSRLTTYAQCCTSDTGGLPGHADVVGYNQYFGWYAAFGPPDQFGAWADRLHAQKPDWKLGMSEYGAGGAVTQHADAPTPPEPYGRFHPEEWQSLVHEAHWKQMSVRPYLWSKIIWNMFDFAVDSRHEGEAVGRNDKGMVTYDRKTRKDAFYWYKANWSAEPVVYIASRRFTERTTATVPVKVYSNRAAVELKVNGRSLGTQTSSDHVFSWPRVALEPGVNTIEATGRTGSVATTDGVRWTRR